MNALSDPVIRRIPAAWIVERWQLEYGMDVSRFFVGIDELTLRRDPATGLDYFDPHCSGDGAFYSKLQTFPWYYTKDKWEHRQAIRAIYGARRILEIGCATGNFLRQFLAQAEPGAEAMGLELNEEAVRAATAAGLNVRGELVQTFAETHAAEFDAVCSFEVLEHIADPEPFLAAAAALVRPGGWLVTAVPDNDSFIGLDETNIMNQPPHHALLWREASLRAVLSRHGFSEFEFFYEPLQPQHVGWYASYIAGKIQKLPAPWSRLFFKRPVFKALEIALHAGLRRFIRGHTILVLSRKAK